MLIPNKHRSKKEADSRADDITSRRPFPAGLDRTAQRGERRLPFLLARCLTRAKIDSKRAELRGTRSLRRISVHIHPRYDLEIYKPGSDDRRLQLCLDQSAGNSPLPQVYVTPRTISDVPLHDNVPELKPPARLQHTRHLLKACHLVGE